MTLDTPEWAVERIVAIVMLVAFWIAFITLAAGLMAWLMVPNEPTGSELLNAGLLGLLALPLLRLVAAIASGVRDRDWLMVGATVAVLVILFALTIRDASRIR
jgi:hypothetical protein